MIRLTIKIKNNVTKGKERLTQYKIMFVYDYISLRR